MYNRWKALNEGRKIMEKCRHVNNLMNKLNLCIKSVADNAFVFGHDNSLKEKALIKLFGVFREGLG